MWKPKRSWLCLSLSLYLCLGVAGTGCRTRLLGWDDVIDLGGLPDAARPPDLSRDMPPDLTVRDLVLPVICRNVYAVDTSGVLSSFDTEQLRFDNIGVVQCKPSRPGATPFSMSISRDGFAYVLYSNGEIFQVNTSTAACQKTPFQPNQPEFDTFGMGFVADMPGGQTESLYIASATTMAVVGLPSFQLKPVAPMAGNPELTGTADAELWGFFPGDQSFIGRIDKLDGTIDKIHQLPSLGGQPQSWAFAFWGGSFWIFLRRQGDPSTGVYRLDRTTGAFTTVIPASSMNGRDIVGAGVSSCAPLGMDL